MFKLSPLRIVLAHIGLTIVLAPVGAQAQSFVYRGMCEASAAVAIGPDHFLVADDNDSTLRFYARNNPKRISATDFSTALGVKPTTKTDIEGAASIGNRIYWITSHGRHSSGEERPQRQRFFATDVTGQGADAKLTLAGTPYLHLLDDLLADPALASYRLGEAAMLPPEAEGGFNIEGLAATPEGKLLIGFRNPIRNGKALVVPIDNPQDLLRSARAKFGKPIGLGFDGRGIRSIDRVGDAYLIVAGPFGRGSGFALYRWSGAAGDSAVLLPQVDLAKLHPEALFAIPGTDLVQILSDDGGFQNSKCESQSPDDKEFRSIVVKP
jgi:hypothetical protein